MSASREKKKRQEFLASGGVDPKTARAAEQQAAEKKAKILYSTLAVVFVVVAVFLVVYNSGILQRSKTAVTIDGENYTVADVSYYYGNAYQSVLNNLGSYATIFGLDTTQSLKEQTANSMITGSDEDMTWDEYFKNQAVSSMKFVHAVLAKANEEGMTLDDEDMETFDANVEQMKTQAASAGYSYKAYLSVIYGSVMTPSVYESNLKDNLLVSKYANAYYDSLSFTDEEVQAYYEENKNTYDLVDGGYVYISGAPETKTDDDGNTVEATDEEKAAAMEEAKAAAEEILAAYEDGKTLEELAETYGGTYIGSENQTYSSNVGGDWLFDESRKAGDTAVLEDESNSRYYVAVFNSRRRDETPGYSVRHILITEDNLDLAEGEEATDEMLEEKAQQILSDWDGTEEGFASLAEQYSQDTGSNTNGGLYEDVVTGSMVTSFNNGCYEDGRKAGDTGIVSSDYGYHIMYFVGYSDDPTLEYWYYTCNNRLISNAYSEWQTETTDSVTAEVQNGMDSVG